MITRGSHLFDPGAIVERNTMANFATGAFLLLALAAFGCEAGNSRPGFKDVDQLCIVLHCGLQSAACFADSACRQVAFFSVLSSGLHR